MEMDPGKLFIGGISWETNEERLRDYFQTFGEVIEAVIMKDRTTGRARGFGFVVFSDPTVAKRVVKDKHIIDGRSVEAKKAVPRDDQRILNRTNGTIQGSPPLPTRTKKIFVGGLASTVTEDDFKNYFDQFGSTTDVIVMYDHNTQRPRGFGFITFDSDESVDNVLRKTFHELNGKMVEVKRAVPKESSPPGSNRSKLTEYNHGSSRVSSYSNGYTQGYNPISLGGYGITVGRTGYSSFDRSNYNMIGPISDSVLATNRFTGRIGYGGGGSVWNSTNHDMWGNVNQSYANNPPNWSNYGIGGFGAIRANNFNSREGGGNGRNAIGYGRKSGGGIAADGAFGAEDGGDIGVGGGSFYTDYSWRSSSPDVEVPGLFNYGFGGGDSDRLQKKSVGYVGYSVANRSNRGIAA